MFYAALDVSLRSVAICIIDEAGKVRLERSVPSDVPGGPGLSAKPQREIGRSRSWSWGSGRSDDRPFEPLPELFGHVPHSSNAIAVGFTGFLILDIGVKRLTLIGPHLFAIRSFD